MKPAPAPLGVSIATILALLLTAAPALAVDCMDKAPDCAKALPIQCIQLIGVSEQPEGVNCDASLTEYLSCVDDVLNACAADAKSLCRETRETALWRDARESPIFEDVEFFLSVCPETRFRSVAEARLEALKLNDGSAPAAGPPTAELREEELESLRERRDWFAAEVDKHRDGVAGMESELEELLSRAELARRNYEHARDRNADGAPSPELEAAEQAAHALDERYRAFAAQFEVEQADQRQYEEEMHLLERDIGRAERGPE